MQIYIKPFPPDHVYQYLNLILLRVSVSSSIWGLLGVNLYLKDWLLILLLFIICQFGYQVWKTTCGYFIKQFISQMHFFNSILSPFQPTSNQTYLENTIIQIVVKSFLLHLQSSFPD